MWGLRKSEIGAYAHPHAKLDELGVGLHGIDPKGEVEPQVDGFGGFEGFVFGECGGVFEVNAGTESGIGQYAAVHLLGYGLLLFVGRGERLTQDASIAK